MRRAGSSQFGRAGPSPWIDSIRRAEPRTERWIRRSVPPDNRRLLMRRRHEGPGRRGPTWQIGPVVDQCRRTGPAPRGVPSVCRRGGVTVDGSVSNVQICRRPYVCICRHQNLHISISGSVPNLSIHCGHSAQRRRGTLLTGSQVLVSPSGLASCRSRSVNAAMISGAS